MGDFAVDPRYLAPAPPLRTRLNNLWWELRLGIATRGVAATTHADSTHYSTLSYETVRSILDALQLGPSDVFVDVGSGKGRVLCCAARYPVKRVVGVELSGELCRVARENVGRMRGRRAPVSIATALAQDYDYSDATVLFLFDPFGAETLGALLERLDNDISGPARIAYANPVHDDVFGRQAWLERTGHWDSYGSLTQHSVSFYRTR